MLPSKICSFWCCLYLSAACIQVSAMPLHSDPVVSDLLTSLFRQTIYNRIENLLLDPGKKSTEKQKIIDSAVDNYHQQKMILPNEEEITYLDLTDLTGKVCFEHKF